MRLEPKPFVRACLALCLGLAPLLAAPAAFAADPFYERLLTEGTVAYERHDNARAVKQLRTAVFGLLDEPARLAQGLCVLGLAQAAMDDEQAFNTTFLRVAEIENRFHGYSEAALDPALRAGFEKTAVRLVPRVTLETTKAFARLVDAQDESRLATLGRGARRTELQKLVKERAANPRWRVLLAALDLEEGRPDEAIAGASSVLGRDPANADALAVRGLAQLANESWAEAASDLVALPTASTDPRFAAGLLRAWIELERWAEADRFLKASTPQVRDDKRVKGLAQKVKEGSQQKADAAKRAATAKTAPAPPRTPQDRKRSGGEE